MPRHAFAYYQSANLFLFCPLSKKENIFFLCVSRPAFSGTGGGKHALTYCIAKLGPLA